MKSRRSPRKEQRLREAISQHRQRQVYAEYHADHMQLAAVLDGLNAFGLLEEVQNQPPSSLLCFGPTDLRGTDPLPWVGAVVWYRPKGHHLYETLFLLGLWAQLNGETIEIIAGTRPLNYNAPYYNAESYFFQIQRGFQMYYSGETGPTASSGQLFAATYDSTRRLALRQEIEAGLIRWREKHTSDSR